MLYKCWIFWYVIKNSPNAHSYQICKGHPRVFILINLDGPESSMLNVKFQCIDISVLENNIFFRYLPYFIDVS